MFPAYLILTNRAYAGDLEQGKERFLVKNTHEPLVSREVLDTVQRLITAEPLKGSNKTNIHRGDNILRGKVICGCCGGKMNAI
jgi:hypothetical protein